MHFNHDKCFVMRLTHARNVKQFNYTLGNTTLQETDSHFYLGICITKDLNWNKHIHQITASANHTLAFIRCDLHSCPINIKTTAYTTQLVRPLLEYSSLVWDPHTQILINQTEMVQRCPARSCINNYASREAGCVSDMLKQLHILNLTPPDEQTDASPYSTKPSMDTYPCLSITSSSPYNAYQDI